jgi:predicted MFS family arabinose efflux permease
MTIFIDLTGFGLVIPLLPYYTEVFNAGSIALGILIASFALMQFIFSPILGRLSDKVGRRPILIFSITTSVASFLLFSVANSYLILLISRIVAGLATEVGVAQAYISDITSEKERVKGMGRLGAAQGAGFIVGPAIGGFLSIYGFSFAGYVATILALINLAFALLFLPESKKKNDEYKIQDSGSSLLGGLANTLSKPLMSYLLTILFIMSFAFSAFPVIMPLLAISFFEFTSTEMSYFFVYFGIVQIVFQGLIMGRLSKRINEEKMIVTGSLLMTISVLFMSLFANLAIFLALTTIMMAGGGMLQTSIPSFISKRTTENERGGVLGVVQSISSIARVPGPLIGGLLYELAGLNAPFQFSAFLLMLAMLLGFRIIQSSQAPKQQHQP